MSVDRRLDVPPASPSRLRQCPECGYSLEGLAEEGRCPECGHEYGVDDIVLFGWAGSSKSNWTNSRTSPVIISAATFGVVVFCFAWLTSSLGRTWGMAVTGIVAAGVALTVYRRARLSIVGARPTQVRLTPRGVAQRDGVGPVTFVAWTGQWGLDLSPLDATRYHLLLHHRLGGKWSVIHRPVDFEFECDLLMANFITRHVRRCVTAAGGSIKVA